MSAIFAGLLDDAAVFPPGDLPLDEAVAAHLAHRRSAYAGLVGPLVVAAHHLASLGPLLRGLEPRSLPLAVTTPLGSACEVLAGADAIAEVALVAIEVALPPSDPGTSVTRLQCLLSGRDVQVAVEVPRGEQRDRVIAAMSGRGFRAKLRTGGVLADLYPSSAELAGAISALVTERIRFKATAGLHHAVRNTDPATGFEQHGFLNLMLATDAAHRGASVDAIAELLEERDRSRIASAARLLGPDVRESFCSFGTCSITEPVEELLDLGLLPAAVSR